MKKILSLGLVLGTTSLAYCADVIPNECAFPAAKPLINAKFTAQDASNLTYAASSTKSASYTNVFGGVTNVLVFVKGVLQ